MAGPIISKCSIERVRRLAWPPAKRSIPARLSHLVSTLSRCRSGELLTTKSNQLSDEVRFLVQPTQVDWLVLTLTLSILDSIPAIRHVSP